MRGTRRSFDGLSTVSVGGGRALVGTMGRGDRHRPACRCRGQPLSGLAISNAPSAGAVSHCDPGTPATGNAAYTVAELKVSDPG